MTLERSADFPNLTLFDVREVHTDGRHIIITGLDGHIFTITCFGRPGSKSLFRVVEHPSEQEEAVTGTADIPEEHPELHRPRRDDDDEIPF